MMYVISVRQVFVVQGGLGNQLFQLAKAISLRNNESQVVLNFYSHRKATPRNFKLRELENYLDSHIKWASVKPIEQYRLFVARKLRRIRISEGFIIKLCGVYFESKKSTLESQPLFFKDTIFEGYWQNEIYSNEILNEIQFALQNKLKTIAASIPHLEIEARFHVMHLRGTDRKPSNSSHVEFGIFGEAEDLRALERLAGSREITLQVLTDDMEFCHKALKLFQNKRIFNSTDFDEWQALAIMARASDLYIGNGTFAWWGAFLASRNKAKIWFIQRKDAYPTFFNCLKEDKFTS